MTRAELRTRLRSSAAEKVTCLCCKAILDWRSMAVVYRGNGEHGYFAPCESCWRKREQKIRESAADRRESLTVLVWNYDSI